MPFTLADLKSLDDALISGEKQVTINGKSVSYRSIAEIKEARALVLEDLRRQGIDSGDQPARSGVRYLYQGGRGFNDAC